MKIETSPLTPQRDREAILDFNCVTVSQIRGLTCVYTQMIESPPGWQPHTTRKCVCVRVCFLIT